MSKFTNASVYFDRVKTTICRKVKYIINYDVNFLGIINIPWLAILIIAILVPIVCAVLFAESDFYFDIEEDKRATAKSIYWLSVPFTVLTMFGGVSVFWRLYNLYKVNYLTMKTLRLAISVDSVVDIVEWWEIRKYYLYYAMPIRYTYGIFVLLFFYCSSIIHASNIING